MVSATTTCYPRKIAAAVDMWITRYASYRTYPPHNNNSNLSRISVVDPNGAQAAGDQSESEEDPGW